VKEDSLQESQHALEEIMRGVGKIVEDKL